MGEGNSPVTEDDVSTLDALCEGVRLAAEIVDKPTNFMHTDAFLDVSANSAIIDSQFYSNYNSVNVTSFPLMLTSH